MKSAEKRISILKIRFISQCGARRRKSCCRCWPRLFLACAACLVWRICISLWRRWEAVCHWLNQDSHSHFWVKLWKQWSPSRNWRWSILKIRNVILSWAGMQELEIWMALCCSVALYGFATNLLHTPKTFAIGDVPKYNGAEHGTLYRVVTEAQATRARGGLGNVPFNN